ncbi:MAG: ABC transporter ATP-binding protein [Oscillospiraceae bacterium]|nr:ABC transporter ATP-binding protein [Oscillospiraceae bacterium]
MSIIIRNVSKTISKNCVLDNINAEFENGKIYGLTGKNGSGKTMLMRIIAGLVVPTDGEVIINGEKLGKNISFPDSIGILIENPGFIPTYSGFKNLKILAGIQGKIGDNEICEIMKYLGLDPDDKKSFKKYSLGMKQKLGIAAAIMENPELLILDEPFNALDAESAAKTAELIKNYKNDKNIIILACHDYEELDNICDEIFEMKAGKLSKRAE